MSMVKKMATAGAVAAMGLGLAAVNASAYAISGGAYTGTATGTHSFTVAGAYTITCPSASTTFSGSATGSATTNFTPSYGGGALVCSFFGLPASVAQSGSWGMTVTGGPSGGWYTGNIHIPASSTTTISVPAAGCTVTVKGTQQFNHGGSNVIRGRNITPTGVELEATVSGIAFTAVGCPFVSGSSGTYTTGGVVTIPGITIS